MEVKIKTCKRCGETKQECWFPKKKAVCKKCKKWERKHGKIKVVAKQPTVETVPSIAEAFNGWKV